MPSQIELIVKGITMSKSLLRFAENEEWQQFSELELQRQSILSKLDLQTAQVSDSQYDELQQAMTSLITLNSQIETICRQQRDEIADHLKQLNTGKNAKNAYSGISEN
jgi:hypothetical protein